MPSYRNPITVTLADQAFTFSKQVFEDLPEARAFLEGVLARGVAAPSAMHYVKIVARLKRQGRLADVDLLVHNVERTAANAYRRWKSEAYSARVAPVIRALKRDDVRRAIKWLRRGSLIPPHEGKTVPVQRSIFEVQQALAEKRFDPVTKKIFFSTPMQMRPCTVWTLHVPEKPVPAHVDPCEDCAVVELDEHQVEIIAIAFDHAWGHRNLHAVPAESLLFGEPPVEDVVLGDSKFEQAVAFVGPGPISEALSGVRAKVARDLPSFFARLSEGADGVYLSREMCEGNLGQVIEALWKAWTTSDANGAAS